MARSKMVLTVLAAILLVGISMVAFYFHGRHQNSPITSVPDSPVAVNAPTCSGKAVMSVSPIPVDQISTIIPLGNFAPPGHLIPTFHMYYNYANVGSVGLPAPAATVLYSPANLTVTQITKFDNGSATKPFDSYRLDFTICQQVQGYFIHILSLNDDLKAAFQAPYDSTQTSDVGSANPDHTYAKKVIVPLTAGEVLGAAGGAAGLPSGLDFGLSDSRVAEPTEANPARWAGSSHFVCSLDYFSAALSTALAAKIGDYRFATLEPGAPKCGVIYQDQLGTAKGTWFEQGVVMAGQTQPVEGELTLGINNFDHRQQVFALGADLKKVGLATDRVYAFNPKTSGLSDRDFSQITADGQVYCFNVGSSDQPPATQSIAVQMSDNQTLKIGQPVGGKCTASPQLGQSLIYVR